jgi:hypothetical protein
MASCRRANWAAGSTYRLLMNIRRIENSLKPQSRDTSPPKSFSIFKSPFGRRRRSRYRQPTVRLKIGCSVFRLAMLGKCPVIVPVRKGGAAKHALVMLFIASFFRAVHWDKTGRDHTERDRVQSRMLFQRYGLCVGSETAYSMSAIARRSPCP